MKIISGNGSKCVICGNWVEKWKKKICKHCKPNYDKEYMHEWYVKNRKPSVPWLKVSAE